MDARLMSSTIVTIQQHRISPVTEPVRVRELVQANSLAQTSAASGLST
jgi:hypothetical protein